MKTKTIFFMLAVLLLITGCITQKLEPAAPIPVPEEGLPSPQDLNQQEQPADVLEAAEPEPLSEDVARLVEKSNAVKSYSFVYTGKLEDPVSTLYIVGTKAKMVLPKEQKTNAGVFYDTIYLDFAQKKASGYCERGDKTYCDSTKEVTLVYLNFYRKTPMEWLSEIPTSATLSGTSLVEGRNAAVLVWQDDSTKTKMWIDNFYGMPLQVEISNNDDAVIESYRFSDMAVNKYKERDVVRQP